MTSLLRKSYFLVMLLALGSASLLHAQKPIYNDSLLYVFPPTPSVELEIDLREGFNLLFEDPDHGTAYHGDYNDSLLVRVSIQLDNGSQIDMEPRGPNTFVFSNTDGTGVQVQLEAFRDTGRGTRAKKIFIGELSAR